METNFLNFAVTSDFKSLEEGKHLVKISRVMFLNSAVKNFSGEPSEKTQEWKDSTPQLAVTFNNKEGAITHRFALCGFVKFETLTKEEKTKYTAKGRYAVDKNGNRIVCPEATGKCQQILSRLLRAAGMKTGESVDSAEQVLTVLDGKTINISVRPNDTGRLEVVATWAAAENLEDNFAEATETVTNENEF